MTISVLSAVGKMLSHVSVDLSQYAADIGKLFGGKRQGFGFEPCVCVCVCRGEGYTSIQYKNKLH